MALRERGNTLMELLVAVLVVGVGALGVAKLQLMSSQNNRAALHHSTATMLADDMLERLRANPSAAYPAMALGDAPPAFVDCLSAACTPQQIAAFDATVWKCSLGNWHDDAQCRAARAAGALAPPDRQPGLPGGDGALSVNAGVATVTVAWNGSDATRISVSGLR